MSTRNGSVLGATKIVDHGLDAFRWTLGLISEGYTAAEMPKWEADAQEFADFLFTQEPFSDVDLRCGINIYRIDVISDESGADDPRCGGDGEGENVKTYFDASFCADGLHRAIEFDEDTALVVLLSQVPFWRAALVIINSPVDAGSTGGTFPIMTNARSDWPAVGVHELGHAFFGLADEYDFYASVDEEGHDVHTILEPIEPNVTAQLLLPGIPLFKWGSLVDPATAIPTTANPDPDCTTPDQRPDPIDPQNNPVPDGTVGAFEGAHYFHCRAYRPEFECRMRHSTLLLAPPPPFCAVCRKVVRDTLSRYAQPLTVVPVTTSVAFTDTQAGTTVPGQIAFTVTSCLDVNFFVVGGPTRFDGGPEEVNGVPVLDLPNGGFATSEAVPGGGPRTASLWVTYQAVTAGDTILGAITVKCIETGEAFPFLITGNTIAPVEVGVMLCLDQSASMMEPATGGGTKGEALQEAATVFVEVIQATDGIGIVKFDSDARSGSITDAGEGLFGAGRVQARSAIATYAPDPAGLTSIGDAVETADGDLKAASSRYDEMAMVLFTDGAETEAKFISEVSGLISSNPQIFAVGLGTPENLDPATLDILCSGSGGKLLLTGNDPTDTFFLLAKYFLNILAGATNTEIVYDPAGYLAPNAGVLRVPFNLNETDTSADAILIIPVPSAVEFALETPAGDVITQIARPPGTSFIQGESSSYFRVSLPALLHGELAREGTWYALLRLDMDAWNAGDNFPALFQYLQQHPSAVANGLPYSLHFQARSNLKLTAQCLQNSYEPGAELRVRGVLTEYGLPIDARASVSAELTRPDGTLATLSMPEIEPGVFETVEMGYQSGVYHFRVLAAGETLREYAFTREQLVTGFTYHGGDTPTPHESDDADSWCRLLKCLLDALTPEACDRLGIDRDKLRGCLNKYCGGGGRITTGTAPADIDPSDIDPADLDLIRDVAARLGRGRATGSPPTGPARRR